MVAGVARVRTRPSGVVVPKEWSRPPIHWRPTRRWASAINDHTPSKEQIPVLEAATRMSRVGLVLRTVILVLGLVSVLATLALLVILAGLL